MRKINKNNEHMQLLLKNHTSIAEMTLNIVKKDEKTMNAQMLQMNALMSTTRRLENEEERNYQISTLAVQLMFTITKYEKTQQKLLTAVMDAHNKQLNTDIITPEQLKIQLRIIRENAGETSSVPGENAHDMKHLYKIMSIQTTRSKNQLIFHIELPLLARNRYRAHKLIPLPTREGENYLWIEPTADYLVTSLDQRQYFFMSHAELDSCTPYDEGVAICEERHELRDMRSDANDCEVQLLSLPDNIGVSCRIRASTLYDVWIPLAARNRWIYSMVNSTRVTVMCKNKVEHPILGGDGILTIEPHCTLRRAHIEIVGLDIVESSSMESLLPRLNIFEELRKAAPGGAQIRNATWSSDVATLQRFIENQREADNEPMEKLTSHDIHHYSLGYGVLLLIIIIISFQFWQRNRTPRKRSDLVFRGSGRSVSMPNLRWEDV